jgi:hypothetical protein
MTDWHADAELLERYTDGRLDPARAASLEAHVLTCAACRTQVAPPGPPDRLERLWSDVSAAIDAPAPSLVERILVLLGVRSGDARLLAATPALRASWLGAVAVTLAFVVIAARTNDRGVLLFLLVAPLLPLAGVAATYGPDVDPVHDVTLAAPTSTFRLLLLRTAAVCLATIAVGALFALGLPGGAWRDVAWVLPALGLAVTTLALASWWPVQRVAVGVGAAWVAAVVALNGGDLRTPTGFGPATQLAAVALLAAATLIVVARRQTFDHGSIR